MTYATVMARRRGIQVEPIDWWREAALEQPAGEEAAAALFARDYGEVATEADSFGTFEVVNGTVRARAVLTVLGARLRYEVHGAQAWPVRQAWIHEHAWQAIQRTQPKRVLAFVGFFHKPELEGFLGAMGGHISSAMDIETNATAEPAPPEVVDAWRQGLARMRGRRNSATPRMQASYDRKMALWEIAIARLGRCCEPDGAP